MNIAYVGIRQKILVLVIVVSIVCTAAISILGIASNNRIVDSSSRDSLETEASIGLQLLNNQFNGNWESNGGDFGKAASSLPGTTRHLRCFHLKLVMEWFSF